MTGYIGVRCPVCKRKFGNADDIVVCPTCGAPHHRECYFQIGKCTFQEEHINGKSWRPPYEPKASEPVSGERICPSCGGQSPEYNIFCNHCGQRMETERPGNRQSFLGEASWPRPDQSYFIYGGLREDETVSAGLTAREYAAYIGPSSAYYLPRFKSIEAGGLWTVNFSAVLFGFMYYFYRKMYLIGAALMALFLAGLIPSFLYTREIFPFIVESWNAREAFETLGFVVGRVEDINENLVRHYENINAVVRMVNLIIVIFISFLANRLYFDRATKAIHRVRAAYAGGESGHVADKAPYEAALSSSGGVCRWIVALLAVLYLVLCFTLYFYLILG